MELQISTLLFTFSIFMLMVVKIGKRSRAQSLNPKLPPGPWKLPLIGNMYNLVGSLPHHSLRDLAKKHGPLMHLQLGEVSTIIVSSPKVAKEVMKTHDLTFAKRPEILAAKIMAYDCTNISFSPYGNYWRQLRKICIMELLSANRVQSFRSVREEEVSNLIQSISSSIGSLINLSEIIFSMTYSITARAAFSKKCKEQEAFISATKETIILAGGFNVGDVFPSSKLLQVLSRMKPKLEKIHRKIDKILDDIINEHKVNKTTTKTSFCESRDEDLVDILLRLQECNGLEFPITTNNIKAVLLDIFTAGTETSSTTIEWAMSEMMKNPRVMEKAQAEVRQALKGKREFHEKDIQELSYLKSVIKETLRLHPPVPLLLPRECREACEIDGYEIPVKTKVIINAWAIGRDREHWHDAEKFDPERFHCNSTDFKGTNFEYIPFGAGRRICPGISFAVANMELPLAQLLYHFDWKLPHGIKPEDLDMTEAFGATVRRRNDLYLIATPYVPSFDE